MTERSVFRAGKTEYLGNAADNEVGGIFLQKSIIMIAEVRCDDSG